MEHTRREKSREHARQTLSVRPRQGACSTVCGNVSPADTDDKGQAWELHGPRGPSREAREKRKQDRYLFGEKCPLLNFEVSNKTAVAFPHPCAPRNPKLGREGSSVYASWHRFDSEYENKDLRSDSAVGGLSPAGLLGKRINTHRGHKLRKREHKIPYLIVLLPLPSLY